MRRNYRWLKLLDQILKLVKKVDEKLRRQYVDINRIQNGFILGHEKRSTHPKKDLCITFVVEKAFDLVPKDAVLWILRKLGVEQWSAKFAQSMYRNSQSQVRVNGLINWLSMAKLRLHQGSMLNPVLVITVIERLTREMRSRCPDKLLCVDYFTLTSGSIEDLKGKLEALKEILDLKVLRRNFYESES